MGPYDPTDTLIIMMIKSFHGPSFFSLSAAVTALHIPSIITVFFNNFISDFMGPILN